MRKLDYGNRFRTGLGHTVTSALFIAHLLPATFRFVGPRAIPVRGGAYEPGKARDGSITTFDPPGSVGTFPTGINAAGTITGYYGETTGTPFTVFHGFLRARDGTITIFGVPGTPTTGNQSSGSDHGILSRRECCVSRLPTCSRHPHHLRCSGHPTTGNQSSGSDHGILSRRECCVSRLPTCSRRHYHHLRCSGDFQVLGRFCGGQPC